jgi:3-methyladenine DNA glycosylase AlkD
MTHPLVSAVRAGLEKAADPVKAPQMQAYMKSDMPYRGVSSALQKALWRQFFRAHRLDSADEWRQVVLELWRGASYREERYAAIGLSDVKAYAAYRTMASLPMFEEMIVTGAWWDYVDAIASHQIGDILRAEPRRMKPLMRRWASGRDMWKRRAAILCQLGCKRDTDLDLLYACIEPSVDSKEFFLRKAIGWALRQYAWTDAREIRRYLKANQGRLSPLSVREASRNI